MEKNAKIYVAGHRGMLGSAVVRKLKSAGHENLLLRTSSELDLTDGPAVKKFYTEHRPEYVFLCAAKVGGIQANIDSPADFLLQNLHIQNNVIGFAHEFGVKKLLFVGSSCIYPRESQIPIKEEYLLTGPLEPTNEGYALAKVSGIKLCAFYRRQYKADFISAIPPNLFGIGDHYNLRKAHLLPALIRKIHEAKEAGRDEITLWGSGKPRREFMLSDDSADALYFLMENYSSEEPINCGTNSDKSVTELAETAAEVLGHPVKFAYNTSKPDGMLRKLIDSERINQLGWKPKHSLKEGIQIAYQDFLTRIPHQ